MRAFQVLRRCVSLQSRLGWLDGASARGASTLGGSATAQQLLLTSSADARFFAASRECSGGALQPHSAWLGPSLPGLARQFSSLPPHTELQMPALSPTMSQGNIAAWKVAEGQEVTAGDVLAEVETDKATMDWENQDDGFVAKILVPEGERDIAVGTPLLVLVEDADSVAAFKEFSPSSEKGAAAAKPAEAEAPPQQEESAPAAAPSGGSSSSSSKGGYEHYDVNHRVGPAAAKLLRESGLPLDAVPPSGPHRIVTKSDVLAAMAAGVSAPKQGKAEAAEKPAPAKAAAAVPPPPKQEQQPAAAEVAPAQRPGRRKRGQGESYTDVPNSQIRKIIAQRLLESKLTVPHYYLRGHADLTTVTSLRATLKEAGAKVSVNDFIVRAVALALLDVPRANAQWDAKAGEIVPCPGVDISIAVATDKGLITPIVRDAARKSLTQISAEVRELAAKARANKLQPHEFTGGSFTISNLGMFQVDRFAAIINPPQAGILAIGGTQQHVSLQGSQPVATPHMAVTLSADERVMDGDVAGDFLQAFAKNISNPVRLLSA